MAEFKIEQETNGRYQVFTVLVDSDAYANWVCYRQWRVSSDGYVVTRDRPQVALHRRVCGVTDPRVYVDHANGNRLDNRRENLRVATPQQNAHNNGPKSRYAGKERPSKYKGVSFRRGKWRMNIKLKDGRKVDRLYATEEEAAKAYDLLAVEDQGEFARVNFPSGQ